MRRAHTLIFNFSLLIFNYLSGRSSAVERLLAKEKVVGAKPIARSKKQKTS